MSSWPLVIRHPDAIRVAKQHTSRLVLSRKLKPGTYEVQDALVVRRNERHRKEGRFDLQEDPTVATITISDINETTLLELDLRIVRDAGFKTQRDFYDDWLERRGRIDPGLAVWVCAFARPDAVRLLHRRVHRGYTSDPRLGVMGEPEALSAKDLAGLAGASRRRFEREKREELERQRVRSIAARLREAQREGNADQVEALSSELARLAEAMRAA